MKALEGIARILHRAAAPELSRIIPSHAVHHFPGTVPVNRRPALTTRASTLLCGTAFPTPSVPDITSEYLFALTNPGAERALKSEVAATGSGWRPGFQARGMVTFKCPAPERPFTARDLLTPLAFARRLCLFTGKSASREEALAALAAAGFTAPDNDHTRLHELTLTSGRLAPAEAHPDAPPPAPGTMVGTLMELNAGEFWSGVHWHAPLLSPHPAGCSGITLPEDSPSRAWLKLEEAARFFGLQFHPRDVVVELGCAPGGVLLALLRRGVSVIGVDPARLAPAVMEHAVPAVPPAGSSPRLWVVHCRKPAALVSKRDLAGQATWFMSDMNQSPAVAIKECARFIRMCPSIRSAVITLKLTDLAEASEKPAWLQAMRNMGFPTVRLQQLCVHHRELALLGLHRRD